MTKWLWWVGGAVAAVVTVVVLGRRSSSSTPAGRWVDEDWVSPGGALSTRYVLADGQHWGAQYTEPDPNAGTWKAYHNSPDWPWTLDSVVDQQLVASSKNELAFLIDRA